MRYGMGKHAGNRATKASSTGICTDITAYKLRQITHSIRQSALEKRPGKPRP